MRPKPESVAWSHALAPQVEAPASVEGPDATAVGPDAVSPPARVARWERWLAVVRRTLAARWAAFGVVGLALVLTSTALTLKLTADDHFHALALRDDPGMTGVKRAPWDLFAFAKNPEVNDALIEEGVFPWWSDREAVISFLRPLASLTHWVDHMLWPDVPVLMHLHSMAWFAALLLAVGLLYRALVARPWVAGLALLIYAVDDARAMTVGWISNRNALVALFPAVLALWAHHKYRASRRAGWGVLAVALLSVGLLSAEAALQICGYLAAYALCLESGPLHKRVATLWPYVTVVLLWRVAYSSLGYGAWGSEFYVDPGRHPLHFAQNLCARLPVLLLSQFAAPFADLWDAYPVFAPAMRIIVPVVGVAAMALLCYLLWPLWKGDRVLRFWALGTLLATLPACGASPTDRILTATGIGAAALVASFLAAIADKTYPVLSRPRLAVAGGLVLVHLGMAPVLLPLRTGAVDVMEGLIARAAASVPADEAIRHKTLVLVNPPAEHFAAYFPLYRESHGIPRPKHFRWLATGMTAIDVERVDERTLRVRPEGGFLASDIQWLLRSKDRPFVLHQRVELADLTYEVSELTPDARPAEVLVRFNRPLEASDLEFVMWGEHEFVPFTVPKVGERVHIPQVNLRGALLGQG
jgi:hypothetical protein